MRFLVLVWPYQHAIPMPPGGARRSQRRDVAAPWRNDTALGGCVKPTAPVGMPTSFRMAGAKGTLNPGPAEFCAYETKARFEQSDSGQPQPPLRRQSSMDWATRPQYRRFARKQAGWKARLRARLRPPSKEDGYDFRRRAKFVGTFVFDSGERKLVEKGPAVGLWETRAPSNPASSERPETVSVCLAAAHFSRKLRDIGTALGAVGRLRHPTGSTGMCV